ncbi:hypothetical protein COCOBI_12-0190 [Coccomyxa sp. Obi]|nr:hypothetical protein COCOBI_12-0190 [Coccomyxa sp. Obi]
MQEPLAASQPPFEAMASPPSSPSGTIPAFRGDDWDGHAHSAPQKSATPLTPGAVARLKGQLEARIDEERRSRSVEPRRSASPSPMRLMAKEFEERINRTKSPSPPHRGSQSPTPRATSPLKKDSRITDALGWRQPDPEVSGPAGAAATFAATPQRKTLQKSGGLVPLSVTPTVAARFELGRSGSPRAAVDAAARDRRAERMAASMPSTEEALKEIEAAMKSIEAARSPAAAAAAAAQLRTYHNSAFWDPSARTAPVTHPGVQEMQREAGQAVTVESKPRPSAAKALFPIAGPGQHLVDAGHIISQASAAATDFASDKTAEPATPEKETLSEGQEEGEAFPQTPSSLKNAVWGTKLWPAQSPPPGATSAPAGASSAHATGPESTDAGAAEDKITGAAEKHSKEKIELTADGTLRSESAPAVLAVPKAEADEEVKAPRISAWTAFLCLVALAQVVLGLWAVAALCWGARVQPGDSGGEGSPPWWWRFPPQWQFESPPFWGNGPPPQHGFWADSTDDGGMTAADLDSLVSGREQIDWQPRNLWRHVLKTTTSSFSAQKGEAVIGDVGAHAATSTAERSNTALAVMPRQSARGMRWVRSLVRRMQGVMHGALPLPGVPFGQATTAEPQQDTEVIAEQQLRFGPSVVSTVVIFLGTLLTEMVGLYLLTRLALQMMAGKGWTTTATAFAHTAGAMGLKLRNVISNKCSLQNLWNIITINSKEAVNKITQLFGM